MSIRKAKRKVIYTLIRRTNSNIFFSIIKPNGKSVYHTSAGVTGIKGSRRNSPVSGESAGKAFGLKISTYGPPLSIVRVHGVIDRTVRSAVRGMKNTATLRFYQLRYTAPVSHNGVRLKKIRRT